ncbi:hypothetical protein JCM5296_001116 [Sporobolomyces johnsonii]
MTSPQILSTRASEHGGHGGSYSDPNVEVAKIYQYAMAGILGALFVRNVILQVQRFVYRRLRRRSSDVVEKGAGATLIYGPRPLLLRISDSIDSVALKPVNIRGIAKDWTWLRLLMVIGICGANIVCCLVGTVSAHSTDSANTAKALARRSGFVAVSNYPILYCFAGRNNVVATLTGIPYQELRFYHILLGGLAFIESFVHTFAYIASYLQGGQAARLQQAYGQLYFKMGIVALVFMLVDCFFGLKWIRRHGYEFFLVSHIVGAALILAGSWYHRPNIQNWVWAAVALWVFERVCRIGMHASSVFHARVIARRPLMQARARVVHGAIKLSAPFPAGKWSAGQHVYISFWGLDLLRKPWLYGQAHPFCISNIPDADAHDEQELRFVIRIYSGLTRTLADHIQQKAASGTASVPIWVSVDGPYDHAPAAEEFDSVLLIAGGSGITHPSSVLADVCQHASQGECGTSSVKLVWAIHRLEQFEWVRETLEEARSHADKANLPLSIDLHVTRPSSPSSSGTSTPAESPGIDFDDKKAEFGEPVPSFAKSRRYDGRPDVARVIARTVADSPGTTLVVACGPVALADEVRCVCSKYAPSVLQVQIATYEC